MIEDTNLIAVIDENTNLEIGNNQKILYVVLYVNNSDLSVRDSNRQDDGRLGKTVILPRGVSVKHGKSEVGHLNRRILDYKHLRYINQQNQDESVYPIVIMKSFFQDFSNLDIDEFRELERKFNRFIKDYLSDNNLDINPLNRINWINNFNDLEINEFRLRRGDWRQIDFNTSDFPDENINQFFNDLIVACNNFLILNNG